MRIAILRTYWVLVVMDQFTRRIVGFGVHRGVVDGVALCGMFNRAIHAQTLPKYLSSDHDPAVSVPSVAGQPPCPHGPGNQNGALRSAIASVSGEIDRNDPAGLDQT